LLAPPFLSEGLLLLSFSVFFPHFVTPIGDQADGDEGALLARSPFFWEESIVMDEGDFSFPKTALYFLDLPPLLCCEISDRQSDQHSLFSYVCFLRSSSCDRTFLLRVRPPSFLIFLFFCLSKAFYSCGPASDYRAIFVRKGLRSYGADIDFRASVGSFSSFILRELPPFQTLSFCQATPFSFALSSKRLGDGL